MEYKGDIGNIEFSEKDGIFYGKVQGIRSLISYEGENAKDLINDFHIAVEHKTYLNSIVETALSGFMAKA